MFKIKSCLDLNVFAPYTELKSYVPVYRIFVNRQDAESMSFAIETIFNDINIEHKNFKIGHGIEQMMVNTW